MHFIEFGDPGCKGSSRRKVRPKIIWLPGRLTLFPALCMIIFKRFYFHCDTRQTYWGDLNLNGINFNIGLKDKNFLPRKFNFSFFDIANKLILVLSLVLRLSLCQKMLIDIK